VRASEPFVMTDPDELAIPDDGRPDERVGLDGTPAFLGRGESGSHPMIVVTCHELLFQRRPLASQRGA